MSALKRRSKNSNSESADDEKQVTSSAKREWTPKELQSLLDQVNEFANSNGRVCGYKSTRTRIDWSTMHIPGREEAECREALTGIIKQLRCERTMQEIIEDARALLNRGELRLSGKREKSLCSCPAKKPSLFLMYRDTVLQKVHQANPGVSGTELMRIIGKMYKELSEKRKKRLEEEFKEREAAYKAEIERARSQNPAFECPVHFPDAATRRERSGHGRAQGGTATSHRAPKPLRPVEIYVAKKLDSKDVDPQQRQELTAKYSRKYEALSDLKKLKWIRRAQVDLETKYREAAIAYWQTKPKFKPVTDIKRLLSAEERRIFDVKKEKQPMSLYTYFATRKLREMTDVKSTERLSVVAHMWKEISPTDKKALEVEWQRERENSAGQAQSPAKGKKRKASKSDDESNSENDSPKRGRLETPVVASTSKRAQRQASKQSGSSTPTPKTANAASKQTVNNNKAQNAKLPAAMKMNHRTALDVKPDVADDSDETDTASEDEEDEKVQLTTAKPSAAANAKKTANSTKAVNQVPKASASRQPVMISGDTSSEDEDDSD